VVAHQPIAPPQAGRAALFGEFARDFLRHIGPRRWQAGSLLLLGALVEGLGILLLLPLLSVVLGTSSGNKWVDLISRQLFAWTPGASPAAQLSVLLLLFALLLAARALIILRRDVLLARLQLGFVDGHRLQIIRAVADTRWDVLARLRHARITHVLGSDVQACGDAATMTLHAAVSLTTIAGQVALVAFLSPVLAAAILALLALGMWSLRPWLARSRRLGSALTDANLALVSGTTQFLGGLKLAFSQNLQRGFVSEFETVIGQAGERRVEFTRQRTLANLALTGFAALIAGLTILIGIALLDAAAPALIAFLFVIARMNGPVSQLQNAAQLIAHSLPAYRKIKELEGELGRARRDFSRDAGERRGAAARQDRIPGRHFPPWRRRQRRRRRAAPGARHRARRLHRADRRLRSGQDHLRRSSGRALPAAARGGAGRRRAADGRAAHRLARSGELCQPGPISVSRHRCGATCSGRGRR
jgi:ATP-binding cassette subfamily C protein